MLTSSIDFCAKVQQHRAERRAALFKGIDSMLAWVEGPALELPIHRMSHELAGRTMSLMLLVVAWWLALRLPMGGPEELCHNGARYLFAGWGSDPVRTRFGMLHFSRPIYLRSTRGRELKVAPFDRRIGLAAGRMSFDVHLLVAALVARLPFQQCQDVMKLFGGYTPSPRSMHGIVDGLGPIAAKYMETLAAPDDDGEILVIEVDHKGAPHMGPEEHRRRQRKHKKRPRGLHRRGRRRARRRRKRERRATGDKSKNARMASIGVVYTLRIVGDEVEGPIHRRVFGTFNGADALFKILLREATKRGYGRKKTLFVADGEPQLWRLRKLYLPDSIGCLDWYHLSEYLWTAAGAVHRDRSKEGRASKAAWVKARHRELRAGEVDSVLESVAALFDSVGKSGPGTASRRKSIQSAVTYITNQRDHMPYKELLAEGLPIGSGNIEGTAKYIGARLDGGGMRWSKERAAHVLALRCVLASDEWEGFSEFAIAAHEKREEPEVARLCPTTLMTPHQAAKKAA